MSKLRYLTAGESHGKGLTVLLEGLPSGVEITEATINQQLARRQKGYGRGGRMKIETDTAEITAGVRHGKSLGSPLALWVANRDWKNWQEEMNPAPGDFDLKRVVECPRPGHADLPGGLKYDHHDLRNVLERASARETTVRVAVGAVAQAFLSSFGIRVAGHVVCIGGIWAKESPIENLEKLAATVEANEVRCLDTDASPKMIAHIDQIKRKGDTVGGIFEILADGLPVGLGSHVQWDRKLDGRLAQAILSIQAIKGVEFGIGFKEGLGLGSESHDEIYFNADKKSFYHATNRAGGVEGGMTNGERLVLRGVMKPISTLYKPLHSVHIKTKEDVLASVERSDTCAVPAACVIAENVVAMVLADAFLEKFGGDSMQEIKRNFDGYLKQIQNF